MAGRFSDAERRRILRERSRSGLSSHDFAVLRGVSHATLYNWKRELGAARTERQAFVLVFIHVASRRAMVSASTTPPDAAWMSMQATRFVALARASGGTCGVLVRDSDANFSGAFDTALRAAGSPISDGIRNRTCQPPEVPAGTHAATRSQDRA